MNSSCFYDNNDITFNLIELINEHGKEGLDIFNNTYCDGNMEYNSFFFEMNNYNSILHINHTYDTMKSILRSGCEPNNYNIWQMNPLYYQTNVNVIRLLIEYGLDVDLICYHHISYLMGNKDIDAVKYIIENIDENPFVFSDIPYIPRYYETNEYFNPFLISVGFDIYNIYPYEINTRVTGELYLNGLVFIKDIKILIYIFNHDKFKDDLKTLINLKNYKNENILYYIKEPEIFEYILQNGCNPNVINNAGCNLLQYHTDLRIIKLLLKYGCNINYRNIHYINSDNVEIMLSVCDYHLLINQYKQYVYLNRYRYCLKIQRSWRIYINGKKYIPPENIEIKKNYQLQLTYLPPIIRNIGFFKGGIEYQRGLESFMNRIKSY